MAIEVLACDLDGTLAETYMPLSADMVDILQNFKDSGRHLVILTDEIEENIESRVSRLFRDKSNLHVFPDGGAVGFGFANNERTEYYKKNLDSQQIQMFEDAIVNIFGEFRPEPDRSRYRHGVQVKAEPTNSQLDQLEFDLRMAGLQETMSYIGRGILRFNPFGKHKALEHFLQLSGIPEENVVLIADQTAKYRNDWRLFDRFRKSVRAHVGTKELAIDDDSVLNPGEMNEHTTLAFLRQLKTDTVVKESFYSNDELYQGWIKNIHIRTGTNQAEIERKIKLNKPRYPILPEEQAIYLLPFLKRVVNELYSVPVVMARGMLPAADIIRTISERGSLGRSFERPLIMKTASFEDMSDYNPHALTRKEGLKGDFALSITINTLLGEEAFGTLNDGQKRIRDREGLKSNNIGGLVQETGPDCIDESYRRHLRRFYTADFYQASFAFYNRIFDSEIFIQNLQGLSERERTTIRSRIAESDGRTVNDWETVWRINQEAIRKFHEINPVTYKQGISFNILKDLLACSSFARRYGSKPWMGLDDSQLTGRSGLLFQIIAEAFSPGQKHSFGVFSSTTAYGQNHFVDFVITNSLLFPEKEMELYDGLFRLNARDGIWSYVFTPFDSEFGEKGRPDLERVRTSLREDYLVLEPFFRKDTPLDPFEFIIFNYLSNGQDSVVRSVLEEYLPNRNDNPHFIDLGRRVIEFSRKHLPWFERKVDDYRRSQRSDPFENVDVVLFRNYLYQMFNQEIKSKREQYQQRQMQGVIVIEDNLERVTDYLDNRLNFETLKKHLIPKIYAK